MYPVLFEIPIGGGLRIHSYGLMIALGFLAALLWIRHQSKREGLNSAKMLDLGFLMLVMAIVGSRLVYILVEWRHYLADPLAILKVWEGGLVFYGGLLACLVAAWLYMKKNRLPFLKVSDVFIPGVSLGHAFGRVGCFFAGCCYGRQCEIGAWYGVVFPAIPHGSAPAGIPLYPTQLIEAGGEFILFGILAAVSRKKAFDGQILILYLIGYSLLRFLIEFFRGDPERGYLIPGWLSTSQFISILLILLALLVLIFGKKGRKS